jgi:NitT/TauT family transport system substrate-binding protein
MAKPAGILAAALLALVPADLRADDAFKLRIACTATSGCLSAMVARDEGIFASHGIDAQLILLPNNIPAALAGGSADIGGPTVAVFLQAVDGGLDLVAVAGGSIMDPVSNGLVAAVAREGLTLKTPKDFVGRKVGVPGLNALLHVLFRKWLIDAAVDPKGVNFVEVAFPTMADALKSGSVDAVLTTEPFVTRIRNAGTGEVAAHYLSDLARGEPIISYIATRAFATAHPDVIRNFKASIEAAAPIVNGDRDKANAALSRFNKVPYDIVKLNRPDIAAPVLKLSDLNWWVATLKQQDMLQTEIDLKGIVTR